MKDRNIRKISIVILMLFTVITNSCSLFRKQKTPDLVITPLSDTIIMRSGSLIYALPMTVFTVSVQMERTIELPGPYAKYAGELLGLTDVIMQEDEHWEIKDITVSSHEEVDPSEFYVIESSTLQQTNALALKKSGLIMDLNPGLNVPVVAGSAGKEFNINDFRSFDLGADEYFRVNTDTAYKRARVDGQFIRIPYVVEKNTWFGPGHTIPNGKEALPLSPTMQQNYFLISDPILLEQELAPITVGEKNIHFLTIIPIFEDEMDMKAEKGSAKFFKKFMEKGGTEILDDYRRSTLKSKWRMF